MRCVRRALAGLVATLAATFALGSATGARAQTALASGSVDRLVVYKADHVLEAWSGDRLLKRYTVAIGIGGAGAKRHRGDRRTPEGTYGIDRRHVSAEFHRFLHVSYPNAEDRVAFRRGRAAGTIPRDVDIGSDIGIHGEARDFVGWPHKLIDWTAGCIALDNDEIEELYRAVGPDALLVIHP